MGRSGITYDQVAAAADALFSETGKATLKDVRERLGTGGMGTIHKHLTAWNANRPKDPAPQIEMPADMARSFSAWVTQASTAARADAEERLVTAQAEAQELARAGEQLEAERDALLDQITSLTTERDQAQGAATERAAEIERLGKEVERERQLAGAAQVEAAQAKLKAEGQTEQLADLKASNAKIAGDLDAERLIRVTAERDAAVFETERDAARKEAEEERTRIKGLQAHLDKAHQDLEALRASTAAEIKALRDQYEARLAEAIKTEREAVEKERTASVENASLQAQLAALQRKDEGDKTHPTGGFRKNS
jgi:chromosome segregation ATPase